MYVLFVAFIFSLSLNIFLYGMEQSHQYFFYTKNAHKKKTIKIDATVSILREGFPHTFKALCPIDALWTDKDNINQGLLVDDSLKYFLDFLRDQQGEMIIIESDGRTKRIRSSQCDLELYKRHAKNRGHIATINAIAEIAKMRL